MSSIFILNMEFRYQLNSRCMFISRSRPRKEGDGQITIQTTSEEKQIMSPTHDGMTMKSTRRVMGHSLLRLLVHSRRSLIRLLRTARFARALRCFHTFARSLAHSGAHGKELFVYELNASN